MDLNEFVKKIHQYFHLRMKPFFTGKGYYIIEDQNLSESEHQHAHYICEHFSIHESDIISKFDSELEILQANIINKMNSDSNSLRWYFKVQIYDLRIQCMKSLDLDDDIFYFEIDFYFIRQLIIGKNPYNTIKYL